jgi:branched-chain amino acid transport system ATP-binding protein
MAIQEKKHLTMGKKLTIENLSKRFSGLQALNSVSIRLPKGEIMGLIGPNGSGKTTLINSISGVLHPEIGRIMIGEEDITGWSPDRVARLGLARTFQTARLFGSLTVIENLELGVMAASGRDIDNRVDELLDRFGLTRWATNRAGTLAYGLQRRLEIARAIGTNPEFLLLDEPAAGLNEEESELLLHLIRDVREPTNLGCGILIVEHDLAMIMRLCDRVHVLNEGQTLAEGPPDEVRNNPAVVEAYMGKQHVASGNARRRFNLK